MKEPVETSGSLIMSGNESPETAQGRQKLALRRGSEKAGGRDVTSNVSKPSGLTSSKVSLESDQRYRALFEGALNPIMLIDGNGDFTECNGAALKFFECLQAELLSRNIGDFVPPGKESIIPKELPGLCNCGETIENEYYVNGSTKVMKLTISTIELQGQLLNLVVGQDITQHKLDEIKLLESEERFRSLSEQSLLGIAIYANNRFQYVNRTLAELVDYTTDELLSWNLEEIQKLVHPHDLLFGFRRLKESEPSSFGKGTYQLRIMRRDGGERSVEIHWRRLEYCGETAYLINMIDVN